MQAAIAYGQRSIQRWPRSMRSGSDAEARIAHAQQRAADAQRGVRIQRDPCDAFTGRRIDEAVVAVEIDRDRRTRLVELDACMVRGDERIVEHHVAVVRAADRGRQPVQPQAGRDLAVALHDLYDAGPFHRIPSSTWRTMRSPLS